MGYLASMTDENAALASGLPGTTLANGSRFVFATLQAYRNLTGDHAATTVDMGEYLALGSTGDDLIVVFRSA
jgi:hypothetical protein